MSWLFSNSETGLLLELNHIVRQKTLELANKKLSLGLKSYSPWMSNIENLEKLSPLFEVSDIIIRDNKALSVLAQHYAIEMETGDHIYPGPLESDDYDFYLKALEYVLSVPSLRVIFNSLIKHIVPLNPKRGTVQNLGAGSSTLLGRGAIFLSIPDMGGLNSIQLAINIAHELGHQSLMIYQVANRIVKNDLAASTYSYVRKEKRPIIQSFHASFALAFMTEFLQEIDGSGFSQKKKNFILSELKRLKEDFSASVGEFKNDQFTTFGSILLGELKNHAYAS